MYTRTEVAKMLDLSTASVHLTLSRLGIYAVSRKAGSFGGESLYNKDDIDKLRLSREAIKLLRRGVVTLAQLQALPWLTPQE